MLRPDPSAGSLALARARTFLFVPANRPERFDKALASGADVVIVDLEDSVAPEDKAASRAAVSAWLDPTRPVVVRVNPAASIWFEDDLAICCQPGVAAITVPRAEPGASLTRVAALMPVLALIETAVGVQGLAAIAETPGVVRLGIGAIDLSLDLGITAVDILDPVLLQMVVASRAAGLASPVAGVTADFRNFDQVTNDTERSRSLGFSAKLCIHPAQLAPVRKSLAPSAAQISHARRIMEAAARSGGSAVALDGRMIDRPVIDQARRVLEDVG